MKDKVNVCETCKHWKNQQAELEYSKFSGICTCYHWKFSSDNNKDVKVLDRQNVDTVRHLGVQRFESQSNSVPFGAVEKSRYCLVTGDEFGCIHHEN